MHQNPSRVSVHGGHSGQFCSHADDLLEEIVVAYLKAGYSWIGLTEHMPPDRSDMILPEEACAGMDVASNQDRFLRYIVEARRLQALYEDQLTIYVGFETEAWSGYQNAVRRLEEKVRPDYIVGSIHHVNDIPIDFSPEHFEEAAAASGGIDALYCDYFDLQWELVSEFKPAVVGHFDLIRLMDTDYRTRIARPEIWKRIVRNLGLIRDLNLILDYNLKALAKGQTEPYVSRPILALAIEMGIAVVPGDDTHRVSDVDQLWKPGVAALIEAGTHTDWKRPAHL